MYNDTNVILGIDAGTTSVKTVVFDMTGGIVGLARSSVHLDRGEDGSVETGMDALWEATASTVIAALEHVPSANVLAIGVTGQGDGAWLIDSDNRPIRPAALWLDGRAAARVDEWTADGRAGAVQGATGSPLFSGALPVLLEAIQEAEPESISRAVSHLNCKDWLRFRMVGEKATDPSEASRTFLDTATLQYSNAMIDAVGNDRVRGLLAPVRAPHELAGTLTEEAARAFQLPSGIPVSVGLVDTAAAAVGLGAIDDGAGYVILGTTGFVGVNQPSRADVKTNLGIVLATGRGSQVLEALSPMNGTPNLDWVRHVLERDKLDWRDVEDEARAIAPGSNGVLYLPYGSPSGERAPFVDANASAAWLGLSTTTTAQQLLRSVYEGVAYALTECMDLLDLAGTISICGGGSESTLACQILADVSGRTIHRQNASEVGARGAAALALVAAGYAADLSIAVRQLGTSNSVFEPEPAASNTYRSSYKSFLATRDALRPHWPSLRSLRG